MATASPNDEFVHLQDVLGRLPMLRNWISICLCFTLRDSTRNSQLEHGLKSAVGKLGQTFPFLAGQVLIDGIKEGHSGVPKIVRRESDVHLVMNDLTSNPSIATNAAMSEANYPKSMLDPTLLLPSLCFEPFPEDPDLFAPVFMVQANVIRGGVLLVFIGNHQIMDATGLGYLIELYAKALRGEDFTKHDIETVNQPRGAILPMLGDDYRPGPELDDIIPFAVAVAHSTAIPAPNKAAWFRFTASNLEQLKSDASNQDVAPYVSTDDAVGALFWRAVTRARRARLGANVQTKFTRPINVRRFFGLEGYVGHMADTIYTEAEDVYNLPLGTAAGKLRLDLLQDDKIRHHVQALATMCNRLSDRSGLIYGANADLERDVLLSSWTNMGTGAYSYGDVLGIPEAMRCLKDSDIPAIITLPKDKDGSMTLMVCFAESEMEALYKDEDVLTYGKWMH